MLVDDLESVMSDAQSQVPVIRGDRLPIQDPQSPSEQDGNTPLRRRHHSIEHTESPPPDAKRPRLDLPQQTPASPSTSSPEAHVEQDSNSPAVSENGAEPSADADTAGSPQSTETSTSEESVVESSEPLQ